MYIVVVFCRINLPWSHGFQSNTICCVKINFNVIWQQRNKIEFNINIYLMIVLFLNEH